MQALSKRLSWSLECHAWNADCSQLAVSPNNNEIHIYQTPKESPLQEWSKLFVLDQHDQRISAIDWAAGSGKLLSCSHDRNAYVWSYFAGRWQPDMVIMKHDRAALCARWSPCESKFAVGSGAKTVCICYYEEKNNWWASRVVRRKHSSSVVSVAWHPNSELLATASTDFKCRVFNARIAGSGSGSNQQAASVFGDLLFEVDCGTSWTHSVAWSLCGTVLAVSNHHSAVTIVEGIRVDDGPSVSPGQVTSISLPTLPLRSLLFLSGSVLAGAGYDGNIVLLKRSSPASWALQAILSGTGEETSSADQLADSFTAKLDLFKSKVDKGDCRSKLGRGKLHSNVITELRPLGQPGTLSSCGLDGRIGMWNVAGEMDV